MAIIDINSPYYPYIKTDPVTTFLGLEEVPKQVIDYLLNLPLPGYEPPDNNDYPRTQLIKYLFYDDATPLANTLPTTKEKISIVYDAETPTTPPLPQKGFRIYPQTYVSQSQTEQQTILRVYMGRIIPRGKLTEVGINFDILSSLQYESNLKGMAVSRSFAIERCILGALNGVNMNGIGSFYYDRNGHPDCGSYQISDERMNVGRRLTMAFTFALGTDN